MKIISQKFQMVFTACKKTENCPPWELSADKIKHDSEKKIISYKNVWLKFMMYL